MLESYTGRWSRGLARLTLPIGPIRKSARRSSWDSKGFSQLHPVLYRNFGRTRRSFRSPRKGKSIACDAEFRPPVLALAVAACASLVRKKPFKRNSEPFKFYRKEGQFTRRFAGCDLPISLSISAAYVPSTDAFGGRAEESHVARHMKLSLVQRVEYKRTLAARF